MRVRVALLSALLSVSLSLTACSRQAIAVAKTTSGSSDLVNDASFQLTASIQDIMHSEIDPSADFLWESIGTTVTKDGEVQQQPRTAEEWNEVRNRAITLIEATNLLVMTGRKVVADGKEVEDAHVTGIRNAREIQAAIDADRATWIAFAHSLHAVGEQTLKAIDARDPAALLTAGAAVDAVCEACHLKYWYPGQVIPPLK